MREYQTQLKDLYPLEKARQRYLEIFNNAINHCKEIAPDKWAVYDRKDGLVSLVVGNVLVAQLDGYGIGLSLSKQELGAYDNKLQNSAIWKWSTWNIDGSFKVLNARHGHLKLLNKSSKSFDKLKKTVIDANRRFIEVAAGYYTKLNRKYDQRKNEIFDKYLRSALIGQKKENKRAAVLLIWNPKNKQYGYGIEKFSEWESAGRISWWTVGNMNHVPKETPLLLIRLGEEPKGIVGTGRVRKSPKVRGRNQVELKWVDIQAEPFIYLYELEKMFPKFHWTSQSAKWIPQDITTVLDNKLRTRSKLISTDASLREQEAIQPLCSKLDKAQIKQKLRELERSKAETVTIHRKAFKRNALAVELIKEYRDHKCQICGWQMLQKTGRPYIEAAHITPKHKGGTEESANILILCPNHHKKFDVGKLKVIDRSGNKITFKLNGKVHRIRLCIT